MLWIHDHDRIFSCDGSSIGPMFHVCVCVSVCQCVCLFVTKNVQQKEREKERDKSRLRNFEKKIQKKKSDLENFDFNFFQNANEKILLFYCSIVPCATPK